MDEANELKVRGNDLFRESSWQGALEAYMSGLKVLPVRPVDVKGKGKASGNDSDDDDDGIPKVPGDEPEATPEPKIVEVVEEEKDNSPLGLALQQCAVVRSILNSNIAACHVKLVRLAYHPLKLAG